MILTNKARCCKCGDAIESKHVHDFVACKCGAIFVDGGKDYLRRGGEPEDIEELSETTEDTNWKSWKVATFRGMGKK